MLFRSEDDGMTDDEFKDTMLGLGCELEKLSAKANTLDNQIAANLKVLFEV